MDNAHGRGIPLNGKTEFWISLSCPLHAGQVEEGCMNAVAPLPVIENAKLPASYEADCAIKGVM